MWPRQIKMANDKMIIHSMARRLLMLLGRHQRRYAAVIWIHNLSITLWWAIYDLSLRILYICKSIFSQSVHSLKQCWSEFLLWFAANGGKARNSCYLLQHQRMSPTAADCSETFPIASIVHVLHCNCAPDACWTQNKRKSFQLKI